MLTSPVLRRCVKSWPIRTLPTRRTCITSMGTKATPEPVSMTPEALSGQNVLGHLDPLRKVGIIFTCTVCQVRSAKSFSYQSYTKGVVIIRCPSCDNNHLIADNLGWFKDTPVNIETIAEEKGQKVRRLTNLAELHTETDVEGLEKFRELFNAQEQGTPAKNE